MEFTPSARLLMALRFSQVLAGPASNDIPLRREHNAELPPKLAEK
jgi:hypothetical protein